MRKSSSSYLPIDTMSYVVQPTDSLSSIAAHFGTTTSVLKHLNRLMCDLVFPGQVLFVPNKEQFPSSSCPNSPNAVKQEDVVIDLKPKRAGHAERLRTSSLTEVLTPPRPLSIDEVKRLNDQCDERFIKVHVNRIMHQQDEAVNGVMLVTPDCIMFDPDEACPLVVENGTAKYSMTVAKQSVISVSVYHEKDYSPPVQDYNAAPLSTSVHDEVCDTDVQHGKLEEPTGAESPASESAVGHVLESDDSCHRPLDGVQDSVVSDSCVKDSSLEQPRVDINIAAESPSNSVEATHFDALNQSVARTMPTCCVTDSSSVAHSDKSNIVNTNCRHCSSEHFLSSQTRGSTEFLPLHLCISVRHSEKYCYSVPYDKIDPLYAFLIQWSYNGDECKQQFAEEQEFVVVGDSDVAAAADLNSTDPAMHFSSSFSKDWEIVNIRELRRRISEAEIENLPLPDLSHPSEILQKSHLRNLMLHLPARAEGSSWRLLYSSSLHGFSLRTLYRQMTGVDSPVLLVIKDAASRVFGTMQSSPVKKSDLFYGTGESYLFTFATDFKKFGWTGYNNFFTKGDNESLCFGASRGNYGLWLDGDLYHGRTQRCSTYDNDLLTVAEDFTIKCLETWSFN